jgi:hypothetical protein
MKIIEKRRKPLFVKTWIKILKEMEVKNQN